MRPFPSAFAFLIVAAPSVRGAEPDFNRDVRPILAARCFKCHGPDDKARKAGLRLDRREDALKAGAFVPGKPDESSLVKRIHSGDPDEVMPPPAIKNPLTIREKQILRAWVAGGAKYDQHWAFVAPRKSPLPVVKNAAWVRNPIDNFVLARLEREGLTPSPEADRHTLCRRVYLDLIGLPPTPEEVDTVVNDKDPAAYEKLVDRLLASPHYGERWARRWLDLARYADTNGFEKDRYRSVWPYRDWVINALNADMPFDQFTIEQLAGDMLPNAKPSQIVATGFHRNTMLNEEGGIDPLEYRYYSVVDRTNVTSTVWLGLTAGCAQCHTHKFDPIAHTEYFRMLAFLNNAEEPELEVPSNADRLRCDAIQIKLQALEADLPNKVPAEQREKSFAAWLATERKAAVKWTTIRPTKLEAGPTKLTVLADGSILASGDAMKYDVYSLAFVDLPPGVTAIRLEALPHDSLPAKGPGRAFYEGPKGDFLLSEFRFAVDGKPVKFTGSSASNDKPASLAHDGRDDTGWAAPGREGKPSNIVLNLPEPLSAKSTTVEMVFSRHYSASLGRFRIAVGTTEKAKALDIPGEIEDLLLIPDEKLSAEQRQALLHHWSTTAPELAAARKEIDDLRKQLPAIPTALVMRERPADNPRPTFRHHRGEFLQPKERVQPGTLSSLPSLPADQPANRLTFARWLVSPANPLVGRVTVNRQWQAFFGRGLVRTLDDFGYQGEAPTNPQLLDWLAVEFVERGWSMKQLHRTIVTSASYRQSSRITPELLTKDLDNKLLARGPRFRLEAEQIRDSALTASGRLSRKLGGPSVFPPQPANVTTEGTYGRFDWKVSDGEDRYRRGLYTFTKRTAPYAMSGTFDAPSGEACTARREVSNSPLQALTMLNDTVLTDCSQALARRVIDHPGKADEKAAFLFRLCLVRPPAPDELALLVKFYEARRATFATDPDRADAVAVPGTGSAADRAAWTCVARALLNLDEFVTKE